MRKMLFALLLIGCTKDVIQHGSPDAPAMPDAASPDSAGPTPMLGCTPATAAQSDLCSCMANIVCDQIYYCLTPAKLATKPSWWSPRANCVTALVTDCQEDMVSDPVAMFPTDFRQCIADIGAATCPAFHDFSSVTNDFPASCKNLRALDTGLGIAQ